MKKVVRIIYRNLSAYKKYLAIVILSFLLVILSFINYTTSKNDVIYSIQQENLALLDGVISFFESYVHERKNDLEELSELVDIKSQTSINYFFDIYKKNNNFENIYYVHSNGNYYNSLNNFQNDYCDISHYLQKSALAKSTIVSDFIVLKDNIVLLIITPVINSNGFVIGVINTKSIGDQIIYKNFANTKNTIFGVDKNGIRIFSLHDKFIGKSVFKNINSKSNVSAQNFKKMMYGELIIGEHYSTLDPNHYNLLLSEASKRLVVSKPVTIDNELKFSLAITTTFSASKKFDGFISRQLILFIILIFIITYTFFILLNNYFFSKKLEKSLQESQESERIKTEFFCNMSHELRTPLTVILSALHIIYKKHEDSIENNEELKKVYYKIKQNCLRLLKIVNNLLDISKIDSEFFELSLKNVNIVDFTENISLSVVPYAEQKNIELLFDTEIEEKIIAIDEDGIEKVLLNLLSNAIKFTPKNGQILINVWCENNYVAISVKDTGIGIPKEKKDIIFKKFTQVDSSLRRCAEGSGLGLSIVKSLVELHNGKIEVLSDSGKGSEFIVYLPDITTNNTSNTDKNYLTSEFINKTNIEFSDIQ